MSTVTIDVSPNGEATVKVEGHAGPGCKQLTKAIEAAIGHTTGDVLTPDFHRSQAAGQQQEQRG